MPGNESTYRRHCSSPAPGRGGPVWSGPVGGRDSPPSSCPEPALTLPRLLFRASVILYKDTVLSVSCLSPWGELLVTEVTAGPDGLRPVLPHLAAQQSVLPLTLQGYQVHTTRTTQLPCLRPVQASGALQQEKETGLEGERLTFSSNPE